MAKTKVTQKARPGGPVLTSPVEPTVTLTLPPEPALAGRRGEAARNDGKILDAARTVFLADPKAPVSAVAKAAGVGISALYRRWPAKEDLLRQLCSDGLDRFIAEAESAARTEDDWAALADFLRGVVAADVHSLTVHLAGTFTPTPEMGEAAGRANQLATELVRRAHKSGRLRPDFVVEDVTLLLEGCAAIRVPDPERAAQLRQRYLELQLDGLSALGRTELPGPPPSGEELNWRWHTAP
jgi:AcrR family transcriptional regulator